MPAASAAVGSRPCRSTPHASSRARELRELTGDEGGAQRVAWTETWGGRATARGKLADLPVEVEIDEAGNDWYTLRGASERAVLIGGHIDSVPNGGWLDGCLNVLAGVEVLRRIAEEGEPPVTVRLVDWADEEGARFGRSLFGSSAAAGSMADQDELRELADADGITLPDALARARRRPRPRARSALSSSRTPPRISSCISSRARCSSRSTCRSARCSAPSASSAIASRGRGQAAHAGSTPMDKRRDALAGAAKLALELRDIAGETGGGAVCTSGGVVCQPGIVTSVVETAEQLLDQRHLDADALAAMLGDAKEAARAVRRRGDSRSNGSGSGRSSRSCSTRRSSARRGRDHRGRGDVAPAPSGPLHDAAEVSRAGIPTVMVFVQSLRGLSHTKLEDTKAEHLELSVQALDRLAPSRIAPLNFSGSRRPVILFTPSFGVTVLPDPPWRAWSS